jgi:hypothetical protein
MVIWYIFPVLVCRTKKNLATLLHILFSSIGHLIMYVGVVYLPVFGKNVVKILSWAKVSPKDPL